MTSMPSESVEPRSSVEIATSTRGTDLRVKVYLHRPDADISEAGDAALAEYTRLRREIDERQARDWADTLAELMEKSR